MTVVPTNRAGGLWAVSATIGIMIAVAVCGHFRPRRTMLVVAPVAAALLLLLGHRAGLSAADMGIDRGSWGRGAAYAAVCIASRDWATESGGPI